MLHHHLKSAVNDIRTLTEITRNDIQDIKEARHEDLFSRVKTKEELVTAFENKKALIDNEISKIAKKNPQKPLEELLPSEIRDQLDDLRESLKDLKSINKHYARMVLAVSEFYNSLLERIIPSEQNGYQGTSTRSASFLKVNV